MAPRLSKSDSERSDAANQRRLRQLSRKVKDVKEGIAECIDLYMSKNTTVVYLYLDRDIEPHITGLVWDELEKQNPEFFRAYKVNLALIKRIARFNNSLEYHETVTSAPHANGSPPDFMNFVDSSGTSNDSNDPNGMVQAPLTANLDHPLAANHSDHASVSGFPQNGIRSASVNPSGMVQSPFSVGMNCPLSSNHGHHGSICGPLQNGISSASFHDPLQNACLLTMQEAINMRRSFEHTSIPSASYGMVQPPLSAGMNHGHHASIYGHLPNDTFCHLSYSNVPNAMMQDHIFPSPNQVHHVLSNGHPQNGYGFLYFTPTSNIIEIPRNGPSTKWNSEHA